MVGLHAWLQRIDNIESRLERARGPYSGQTAPDVDSGERWDAHQVWGHLTEFVEYWIEIFGEVIDAFEGEPIAFGRPLDDEIRLAGLKHGQRFEFDRLWEELRHDLNDLREFLRRLPASADDVQGLRGDGEQLSMAELIDRYLVGHLEEHVAQLEALQGDT